MLPEKVFTGRRSLVGLTRIEQKRSEYLALDRNGLVSGTVFESRSFIRMTRVEGVRPG
jgi:hypothetical protein